MPSTHTFVVLLALALSACSTPDDATPDDDAGQTTHDMGGSADLGDIADTREPADLVTQQDTAACGDCFDTSVSLNGGELALDRAFFGVTDASFTDSGVEELHIEAHRGGGTSCPDESSPSPAQTVIITNVQIPAASGSTQGEADGLTVSYLDFAGELTDDPVLAATNEAVTWGTYDPHTLVLTIDAPLPGGRIAGRIVATRCASMDLNP